MPQPDPSTSRETAANLVTSLGWLILLGGCITLGLRLTDLGRPALLALGGLNPMAAIIGFGVLAWAIVARRGALLVASLVLGATQIWINTPLDAMTGCGNDQADGDLVVLASNVYFQGATADQVALMIVRSEADAVALSEVQPHFFDQLMAIDEINAEFPYRIARPDPSPAGIVLLSRYPISEEAVVGRYALHAVIASPSGAFVFESVHATAPVNPGNVEAWRQELDDLTTLAETETRPLVLAGDFNATEDHAPFRDLLGVTTDGADVAACGWDATWPVGRPYPPVYRLDHVLVNDEVDVIDVDNIVLEASDHQAVRAVLRLSPDA